MTEKTLIKIVYGSGAALVLTILAGWVLWVYEVLAGMDQDIQDAWLTILLPLGVGSVITFVVSLAAYIEQDDDNPQTMEEDTP